MLLYQEVMFAQCFCVVSFIYALVNFYEKAVLFQFVGSFFHAKDISSSSSSNKVWKKYF